MKDLRETLAMTAAALAYSATLLGLAALMVLGSPPAAPPQPDPEQAEAANEQPMHTNAAPAPDSQRRPPRPAAIVVRQI